MIVFTFLTLSLFAYSNLDATQTVNRDTEFPLVVNERLMEMGQVTAKEQIIVSSRKTLYHFTSKGQLTRKIPVVADPEEYIRCFVYDPEQKLYMVNLFNRNPESDVRSSYFRFFQADGTEVGYEPEEFYLKDGLPAVVKQITPLGKDLFLFNIWRAEFNNQNKPNTLALVRRELSDPGYVFVQEGELFGQHTGSKRQFDDNFSDQWAVFARVGGQEFCFMAHTMVPELETFPSDLIGKKQGYTGDLLLADFADPMTLDLPDWQPASLYPDQFKKMAVKMGRDLQGDADFRSAWYYSFSRLSGLYPMGQNGLVLGYIGPNSEHRYYQAQSKIGEPSSKFSKQLYLQALSLNVDQGKLDIQVGERLGPIPGGNLLGAHGDSAFVLVESEKREDGKATAYAYSLKRVNFQIQ